ncbi:MAG: 4Fe-4S binding protein [Chloroflexota bacterium]
MTTRVLRKLVRIDEEKCDGCGVCVPACAEGALQVIDGKARLVSERYCDGLGACLGECPNGAITVDDVEAEEFNEEAVEHHLHRKAHAAKEELPCGCPSAMVTVFDRPKTERKTETCEPQESTLRQWPVQLALVPPGAPFLQGADVLLTADCVPFACAGFHQDLLKDHALLVACPKLDDFQAHLRKLTDILRQSDINSLTVVHMEVPCCSGLVHMAREAIRLSGKGIPLREKVIGVRGDALGQRECSSPATR